MPYRILPRTCLEHNYVTCGRATSVSIVYLRFKAFSKLIMACGIAVRLQHYSIWLLLIHRICRNLSFNDLLHFPFTYRRIYSWLTCVRVVTWTALQYQNGLSIVLIASKKLPPLFPYCRRFRVTKQWRKWSMHRVISTFIQLYSSSS